MKFETVDETLKKIASRFKKIRKVKNVKQEELAKISNVSYGSIKRFETTGEISLHSLVMLCKALDIDDEFDDLFKEIPFKDISEVIKYGK